MRFRDDLPHRLLPLLSSLLLLPLLLVAALPALAQADAEPSQPAAEFGELVEVSEVLLDVLVTDRHGNVVVGLGPDDFVVTEDGEELDLTGVSFYSNRFVSPEKTVEKDAAEPQLAGPAPDEVLADRYFVFLFQDTRRYGTNNTLLIRQQLDAARQARRWVEQEMLGGDWVAVLSYDYKLKVHADFTQDRARLDEAIARAAKGKDPGKEWASRRPDEEEIEDRPSLLDDLPTGKELRKQSETMYEALELVGEATADVLGRKNLMLFGIGFGDLERVAGTGFDAVRAEPDRRYWPDMVRELNDANVAVYPIQLVPARFENQQDDFLNQLASVTGGRYYENFVNFITPMERIADQASGYYLLSYQTSHPADESGYREVEVDTVNPRFRVQARQGYAYGE